MSKTYGSFTISDISDGVGIAKSIPYYLASNKSTGVTVNDPGWSRTVPELTPENKYLWIYYANVKGVGDSEPVLYQQSGEMVTFDNNGGEAPLDDIKVNIEPVQKGEGDPSPTNVRPISALNGVNIFNSKNDKSIVQSDSVPYKFRQTFGGIASDANISDVKSIVGGTVVWNQLINFASGTSQKNGVTYVRNADGSIACSGTASADSYFNIGATLTGLQGHVLFISGCPKGGSTSTYYFRDGYNGTASDRDIGNGKITKGRTNFVGQINILSGVNADGLVFKPQSFDLTQMFGSTIADYIYSLEQATAGAGVEFFRKLFSKDYYEYNAGELISVSGVSAHEMTGFNQWDEEWQNGTIDGTTGNVGTGTYVISKNMIPVFPNQTYYFKRGAHNLWLYFYDANGEYFEVSSAGYRYLTSGIMQTTIPENAHYMRFIVNTTYGTTYNNDICINFSDPIRNGEYEPYKKHSYPLDDSLTLRGIPKLDSNKQLYYDGDTYEHDGTVTRRYGIVDLGSLNWGYFSNKYFQSTSIQSLIKRPAQSVKVNAISTMYRIVAWNDSTAVSGDMAVNAAGVLSCINSAYTDATAFKTAMSGVMLVYELATPTTETADAFAEYQSVDKYGTEEYVSTSIVPVGHVTDYFTGKMYNIQFPSEAGTVYGGTLDVSTGELIVDMEKVTITSITRYASNNAHYQLGDINYVVPGEAMSNMLKYTQVTASAIPVNAFSIINSTAYNGAYVYFKIDGLTSAEDYRNYIAELNNTGTPLEVCYHIAEPTTYHLTPQQVTALVCENHIWSDAESVDISYYNNVSMGDPYVIGIYGDKGQDGTNFKTFTTNYSYTQDLVDQYGTAGYVGTWTVNEDTSTLRVGDTVQIQVENTSKDGDAFIIGIVAAVSGKNVTARTIGLIDKGDVGKDGDPGFGIVAVVNRNSFTEAQWNTYGTLNHTEFWNDTASIRNGARIGDVFYVTGTATDTGNSHTLTYACTNTSGNLQGKCLGHTYSTSGKRGTTWYAGTGVTGTSTTPTIFSGSGVTDAIVGDHYLNTSTQNVYVCTTAGTASVAKWAYEQNIRGEDGAAGNNAYFHVKYSNDGGENFTTNDGEDPGKWMGTYTDSNPTDSTNVADYKWVRVRGEMEPIISKEYTGVTITANSDPEGFLYFASVKPIAYTTPWRVKYIIRSKISSMADANEYSEVTINGSKNTYYAYQTFNTIPNTNYRPIYYHVLYTLREAGVNNGYGHLLGVGFRYAYWGSSFDSNLTRELSIDIIEADNCEVSFSDDMFLYANAQGSGTTNYYSRYLLDATTNGFTETGDRNETNHLLNNFSGKTGSIGIWNGSLFMRDGNGTYQNICTASDGTVTTSNRTLDTTKKANPNGFQVNSQIYYSGSAYNKNTNIGAVYASIGAFDSRYSINSTLTTNFLTVYTPIYLVGEIRSDGLYYLDDVWWTQSPNNTEKIYVHIGNVYDSTTSYCRITLTEPNTWYVYSGSGLIEYNKARIDAVAAEQSSFASTLANHTATLTSLQNQVDHQIETYYYDGDPTLNNAPANEWTTEEDRAKHEGDLYYNKTTNRAFRFMKEENTWKWKEIADTSISAAMQAASAAQDTADSKRRVFTSQPTNADEYDIGDLWMEGTTGDILTCTTPKAKNAAYSKSHWSKLNKYTDDSTANAVAVRVDVLEEETVAYYLHVSQAAIIKKVGGTFDPSTITLSAKAQKIAESMEDYAGWFKIETRNASGTWASAYSTGSTGESSKTYTISGTVTAIRCSLYGDSSFETLLDQQTVPVISESNGVTNIQEQYYLSTSNTTPPDESDSSWQNTPQTYVFGRYYWTRSEITWDDNTTTHTTPVLANDINAAMDASTAANSKISQMSEIIYGTQTATTRFWTGTSSTLTELTDGTQISYWLPYNYKEETATSKGITAAELTPAETITNKYSNDWLKLTLADGTTTAWVPCYYGGTSRLTSHYGANNLIKLTYRTNVGSIAYGWWADANYDANTNYFDRRQHSGAVKAATAITAKTLIGGTIAGYKTLGANVEFDLGYPILYASAAIAANATRADTYEALNGVDFSITGAIQSDGTSNVAKMLYLKGSVTGNVFKCAATNWLTTVVPASADNMYYIPLGIMTSEIAGYFATSNRLYGYYNGAFQALDTAGIGLAVTAQSTIDNLQIGGRNYILNSEGVVASGLGSEPGSRGEYKAINLGRELPLESGTQVTLSFDLYMTVNTANPKLTVYNTNNKGPHNPVVAYTNVLAGETHAVGDVIDKRIVLTSILGDGFYTPTLENDFIEFYSDYGTSNWFSISNIKLEKGNRATDYTVAPEDVSSKIQTALTSIEDLTTQLDGKVETWVCNVNPATNWNASEYESHDGDLWFYTGLTNLTVGSTTIEPAKTYQFNSNGTWSSYNNPTESLFDRIDGKTAIYYGTTSAITPSTKPLEDGDYLVDSTSKKTYRWNGTSKKWEELSDYVSAISDAVNNIEIGGRNLFVNTGNYSTWDASSSSAIITRTDDYIKFTPPSTLNWWTIEPHNAYIPLDNWDTSSDYTLSVDVKIDGLATTTYPTADIMTVANTSVGYGARTRRYGFSLVPKNEEWTHFEYTFSGDYSKWTRINDNTPAYIKFVIWLYLTSENADAVYFRNLQLEKGNKATDWKPAPEDAISSLDVEYYLSTSASALSGGSWSTTAPAWADGKYMWSRQKVTYGNGVVEYKNQTCIAGAKGSTGTAGLNQATLYLYQRSASQPTTMPSGITYTYSTKTMSGTLGSWKKSIAEIGNGTDPIWITMATASSNGASDAIADSEWTSPIKLAQNGGNGTAGYNQATIYLYQRAASAPSKPTATATYTFSTGALTNIPSGWSTTIPTADGNPCYVTTAAAISRDASVGVSGWSDVSKLAEDGYTITLSNENHSFAAGTSAAVAGSTTCDVEAYKGGTKKTCYVGSSASATTLSTGVDGLTCAITNNNSQKVTLTFTAATTLTTQSGTVTVPVHVDGYTFDKTFSFSLSLTGPAGASSTGLVAKVNADTYSHPNNGEVYYHGYDDDNKPADVDGWVQWNGRQVTIPKGCHINPDSTMPFSPTVIYSVYRLTSATSDSGIFHDVCWSETSNGWIGNTYENNGISASASAAWTWNEATDIILAMYVEPAADSSIENFQLFSPPKKYSELTEQIGAIASQAQSDINNLEIGGKNLLRGTATPIADANVKLTRATITDNIITLTPTTSASYVKWIVDYLDYDDYKDGEYTFSCEAKGVVDSGSSYTSRKIVMYIGVVTEDRINAANFSSNSERYDYYDTTDIDENNWKKYSVTLRVPDDLSRGVTTALVSGSMLTVQIVVNGSYLPLMVRNLKLEKGNHATDWTQAPEDVQNNIDSIQIGGRNLLLWTENMPIATDNGVLDKSGVGGWQSLYPTATDDGVKMTYTSTAMQCITFPLANNGSVASDENVILSFTARGKLKQSGTMYWIQASGANVSFSDWSSDVHASLSETEWKKFSIKLPTANANVRTCTKLILFYASTASTFNANDWIELKKGSVQLEIGTRPTDWSPAPEEVKSNIQTAVNSIEVGGRNLILDSGEEKTTSTYPCRRYYLSDEGKLLQDGDIITFRMKAKIASDRLRWNVFNSGGSVEISGWQTIEPDGNTDVIYTWTGPWKTVSGTNTASNTYINIYIGTSSATSSDTIYWAKLERGNKHTDWSPAPEDTQSQIDSLSEQTIEYIVGTQTEATGNWTGITLGGELKAGKTIAYKLPFAGVGNASLTLSYVGGGDTGAKPVFMNNTRVTTHYPQYTVIKMTYDGEAWRTDNYYTNSNTYDRRLHNDAVKASGGITKAHLIAGTASGYKNLAANLTFDLSYPLLYASDAIAAGGTGKTTYEAMPNVKFSNNGTIQSGAANTMLYLKGALTGNTFTIASSNWLTTVIPTSADNMYYIPLGLMTSATNGYFSSSNRLYGFFDGKFQAADLAGVTIASAARAAISDLETQLDQKILTWAQSTNPATAWTTADLRSIHDGDLWYYNGTVKPKPVIWNSDHTQSITIENNNTYKYSASDNFWTLQGSADNLFDKIDGKRAIFYGTPSGSYQGVEDRDLLIDPDGTNYKWDATNQKWDIASETVDSYFLETPFEWSQDGTTATFQAIIYKGQVDVTSQYPAAWFEWYLRTEQGDIRIATGKTYTVSKSDLGYGGTVSCTFTTYENNNTQLTTRSIKGLQTRSGLKLTTYSDIEGVQPITELPVKASSAVNMNDYFMVIDAADGCQVSVSEMSKAILNQFTQSVGGTTRSIKTAIEANQTAITSNQTSITANQTAIATKVSKSGDTMTGPLTLSAADTVNLNFTTTSGGSTSYIRVYKDSDESSYGNNMVIQSGGSLIIGSGESAQLIYNNNLDSSAANAEDTIVSADGAINLYANIGDYSNRQKWRFGSSGSMNAPGSINIVDPSVTVGDVPSSNISGCGYMLRDSQNSLMAYFRSRFISDGRTGFSLDTVRSINGSSIYNGLNLLIDGSGNRSVAVTDPLIWRKALGITMGSSANPVSISANSYTDRSYSFGTTYPSAPTVYLTLNGTGNNAYRGNVSAMISSVSKTEVTVRFYNASSAAVSVHLHWLAIGESVS